MTARHVLGSCIAGFGGSMTTTELRDHADRRLRCPCMDAPMYEAGCDPDHDGSPAECQVCGGTGERGDPAALAIAERDRLLADAMDWIAGLVEGYDCGDAPKALLVRFAAMEVDRG